MGDPSDLLTSLEAAAEFRVHRATVLRWAKQGIVPAIRLPGGKGVRFRRADIEAALANPAGPLPEPEQVAG